MIAGPQRTPFGWVRLKPNQVLHGYDTLTPPIRAARSGALYRRFPIKMLSEEAKGTIADVLRCYRGIVEKIESAILKLER
jgi:hypothetical protein